MWKTPNLEKYHDSPERNLLCKLLQSHKLISSIPKHCFKAFVPLTHFSSTLKLELAPSSF